MSTTSLTGLPPVNLGPLTTVFTPPPACATAVGSIDGGFLGIGKSTQDFAFLGQTCSKGKAVDATSCWPPVSSGAVIKSGALGGWGYYSPGVACPVGYATSCLAVGGGKEPSTWEPQFKLRERETVVGCCPTGYECANFNGQTCLMVATSTTVSTVTCDGSKSDEFKFQTVPDAKASISAFSLFAPMIQINWQSSDREEETSSGAPSKTEITASPTATLTSPKETNPATNQLTMSGTQSIDTDATATGSETLALAPSTSPTSTTDSATAESSAPASTGMSNSTKVGLGVAGGAVAAVAAIVGAFYLWRRKKNQHEEAELDRLYGMKHVTGSASDLTANNDEIPGWYRGQRPFSPMTPTIRVEQYQGGVGLGLGGGGGGGGEAGLAPPSSPYYRPYRPA